MTTQKLFSVGLGRVRHALGDAVTEQQALSVTRLLNRHGLLGPEPEIRPERLVGLAEFAEIMNRTPSTVQRWKALPEPIVRLKAGPIWDREHVDRFKAAHPELCGVTSAPNPPEVQP